jgi:hypothetical protein
MKNRSTRHPDPVRLRGTGQERRSVRRGAVGILADETENDSAGGDRAVDMTDDLKE